MSETKQFDVPEVLAALEAAVEKRGRDYVYEHPVNNAGNTMGCLYVHGRNTDNETPGCIVGQVYSDLLGKLVPYNLEVGILDDGLCEDWIEEGSFTRDALRILGTAQIRQDDGATWGAALAAAKQKAAEV